jgi:hypothetical protein
MPSRPLVVAACVIALASPALAGNRARPAPRKGKMKVTTVVDRTVGGVVVERKLFLRRGGGKRKGRAVTLENKAKALESGTIVTDHESAMPSSMTLKGRLIEKEGSYREAGDSAVITLVRPGAHHVTGEAGKRVYSGGRVRKVTRTKPPAVTRRAPVVQREEPAHGAVEEARVAPTEHRRQGVGAVYWDQDTGDWYHAAGGASLTAKPGSSSIGIEVTRDGRNVRWGVSRFALEEALEFGTEHSENFTITAEPRWVQVVPHGRPDKAIALPRHEVEAFLDETL